VALVAAAVPFAVDEEAVVWKQVSNLNDAQVIAIGANGRRSVRGGRSSRALRKEWCDQTSHGDGEGTIVLAFSVFFQRWERRF
jgi:hypothetical protein